MAEKTKSFSATGRRRTSVARVIITEGTGVVEINGLPFEEYLPTIPLQNELLAPFQAVKLVNKFDVKVVAKGGGIKGQAGAIKLGVARALILFNPELRGELKEAGLLRRDPRMKERKKPGQPGADRVKALNTFWLKEDIRAC